MSQSQFKQALISVSDKTGLLDFIKPLVAGGLKVYSTGGTAKHLREGGVEVLDVSDLTGFPEVMDGRVKTLHPKVHMGLLARSFVPEDFSLLEKEGLCPFDLVVVNLYPFEAALEKDLSEQEQVEFIDIGGPSMLRSAAKSFERLTVVCDPKDYGWILEKGELGREDRRRLAGKVFSHTGAYDSMIASYLCGDEFLPDMGIGGRFVAELRYGENAHQKAAWYRRPGQGGLHDAKIIQGKALSYNNLLDLEAASSTVREFKEITAVGVKHNNPCGVAKDKTAASACRRMLAADPVSIFGGIVALNTTVDQESAEILSKVFLECVVAPEYSPEALEVFSKKKNLRILQWPGIQSQNQGLELRSISGGFLVQNQDVVAEGPEAWTFKGEKPDETTLANLVFAWKVCGHLKSNAIALASENQTVGLGMGQVNRVDAVQQCIERLKKHHPDAKNVVLASDAFFPFPDSIELAAAAGIKWVIQPGGSVKDEEVLRKSDELGVNLVLTGVRHFRH